MDDILNKIFAGYLYDERPHISFREGLWWCEGGSCPTAQSGETLSQAYNRWHVLHVAFKITPFYTMKDRMRD